MYLKMKTIGAVVACAALAGCMTPEGYPQPVSQEPAPTTLKRGMSADRIESTQPVIVRSFVDVEGEQNKQAETTGAVCTLSTPEWRARVVTPQQISLPLIKGKPGPLTVSCKQGDKSYAQTTEAGLPYSSTSVSGSGSSGAFVLGLIVTVAINETRRVNAEKRDIWAYAPTDATELRFTLK